MLLWQGKRMGHGLLLSGGPAQVAHLPGTPPLCCWWDEMLSTDTAAVGALVGAGPHLAF